MVLFLFVVLLLESAFAPSWGRKKPEEYLGRTSRYLRSRRNGNVEYEVFDSWYNPNTRQNVHRVLRGFERVRVTRAQWEAMKGIAEKVVENDHAVAARQQYERQQVDYMVGQERENGDARVAEAIATGETRYNNLNQYVQGGYENLH
ncbi:hypothetical protein DdX_13443 [Ditylenchus destructor]|uniref:Uncharacterized protein n=1 Tax=Ditylenchus destructor TaxID=166010 RepID=A0AAD4MTT8_9BILA|nr:hypothetical protein DdX_13443 [Ditylenchus destructor]